MHFVQFILGKFFNYTNHTGKAQFFTNLFVAFYASPRGDNIFHPIISSWNKSRNENDADKLVDQRHVTGSRWVSYWCVREIRKR